RPATYQSSSGPIARSREPTNVAPLRPARRFGDACGVEIGMPRLILASMRLPVTVRQTPDGAKVTESVGGVATGLRALQVKGCGPWVGWAGAADDGNVD